MTADRDRAYRLEPLDASGIFLGLGAVQCGLVGGGIVLAVVALSAGLPLGAAVVPVLAGAGLSFGRAAGHPIWEWLPLGLGWVWRELMWGRQWAAPLPLWPTERAKGPALPPCLAGLQLVEVRWHDDETLGCVLDRQRHTLTAVVPVSAGPFVVGTAGDQERLLAGWGDVLGQFAKERSVVTHLTWSELARPSGLERHLGWAAERGHSQRESLTEAVASYDELAEIGQASSMAHEVVVAITVAQDRVSGAARRDPGDRTPVVLERALGTAVDGLLRGLRSAGLQAQAPLDANSLRILLRTRIDPHGPAHTDRQGRLADRLGYVTAASAGPLAVETSWRQVRVDGAWHRTYWVACWPRIEVPPTWLEPFVSGGITRTMTVVFAPVPTHQSRRRIERDLVKLESDAVTKEERGRRVDARHRRATDTLLEREQELIAGYPEMAYVGLVTVTGRTSDELDENSEIAEQLAREAGMELRILDGRQDVAWAAALPFGLAPRTLLAS